MKSILDELMALAVSPEGANVADKIGQRALRMAAALVDGLIKSEQQTPPLTPAQMEEEVVGDIWHLCRKKWGYFGSLTDAFRKDPKYDGPMREMVRARIAASGMTFQGATIVH